MRSQLTRRVFRRILSGQPVIQHRDLHHSPRSRTIPNHVVKTMPSVPRRTFFNLFQPAPREIREARLDPGMEKMLELDKRIHLKARMPPPQDLARAFTDFVTARSLKKQGIEDFHATQLLQTLRTIEEAEVEPGTRWLDAKVVHDTLILLSIHKGKFAGVHNALARALFKIMEAHGDLEAATARRRVRLLTAYIALLCQTGDSSTARTVLERLEKIDEPQLASWIGVLKGFAKEDKEDELIKTIQIMETRGKSLNPGVHKVMTLYYAQKDNVERVKHWFEHSILRPVPKDNYAISSKMVFRQLLEFCLRNEEMEWAQTVLATTNEASNSPSEFDAILLAATATGRSVDDMDNMVTVIKRRLEEKNSTEPWPTIDTINDLISFAVSRKDAYTAERYFSLAEKWGIAPNTQSYILQIEYRLDGGDLPGAQAAYSKLRQEPVENDEDWNVMNRLLVKITQEQVVPENTLFKLVDDISERNRTFPADTLIALLGYHLSRDEYFELVDLLQTYAFQYSTADRVRILDSLVTFALDPLTDAGRAWDTYMVFHQIFDLETTREIRNSIITLMFDRERPDLATHVFTRMNRHVREDTRPNTDTYVRAFEGIAKTKETEALEVIHNLLKLDTEVDPGTRLYNSLMIAYAACDAPWRAIEFWDQIAMSDEGPTYESLQAAFRACEKAPFGYRKAKAIWEQLRRTDAEITRELFTSYVACLAGQRIMDDMKDEVKNMAQTVAGGDGPDIFTIGSIYNAAMGFTQQDRITEWAQLEYPEIWDEMEKLGFEVNEMGQRYVNGIDRTLRA